VVPGHVDVAPERKRPAGFRVRKDLIRFLVRIFEFLAKAAIYLVDRNNPVNIENTQVVRKIKNCT